jgi:uncharacterized repeat protein (TIGR01451 family)
MSRKLGEIRRHRNRRWWTTGATLVAVAVFSVVFVASSGALIGTSTFEGNDGNMLVGGNPTPPGNGTKDWANVPVTSIPDGSGKTDDSIGSSKEDDPYPLIVTQSTPPKDDFTSVHLATEVLSNQVYLYQSSIRSAPNGSANENVELNQSTTLSPNGVTPVRTPGDRLITFDFGGGTANITILKWNTNSSLTCADANDSQPCWDSQTSLVPAQAEGAVNDGTDGRAGAIAAADNPLTHEALEENEFQEMSVNLTGTGILPTAASGDCETFASATIKSRSSGATGTFNSDLKDIVISHRQITNCATITVKKHMVGGTDSFVFTGDPAGTISTQDGTISSTVPPGSQHVSTEATKSGWALTDVSCDSANATGNTTARTATFNPTAGEAITCTFTNAKQATLTVTKVCVPANDAGKFNLQIDGSTAGAGANAACGGSTGAVVKSVGAHTVGETAGTGTSLSDYTSVIGGDCAANGSVTLAAGDNKSCTITNTKGAIISVKKVTDPSGDPQAFSFTGDITASLKDGETSDQAVVAGTYHVTESATDGWDLTDISCDNANSSGDTDTGESTFVVTAGQHVTCTYTNTKHATIEIVKKTLGSGGTFDFTLNDLQSDDSLPFQLSPASSGATDTADFSASPGDYSVVEAAKDGWALTGLSCSTGNRESSDNGSQDATNPNQANIHVTAGGFVQCTYTNTKLATLIVTKVVDNSNGGGSKGPGDFSIHVTAAGLELPGSPAAGSGTGTTYSGLMPGTYKVSEDAVSGYNLTGISGCLADGSVVLEAGATVTCTLTNTSNAPPPPPPPPPPAPKVDIQITKTGTPNPVVVGSQVTWTMVVTNNGPNGATGVTVADPVPAGTTFVSVASSAGTCNGTGGVVNCQLGSLAVGASVTITLVTTAGTTGTLTNTATTVAQEQETNTANNTASASVVANGPFVPPVKYCTAVSVAPKKTLFVGRKTTLTLKVTQNGKAVKGIRIKIKGAKLAITTAPSNAKGIVKVTFKPTRAGIVTFAPVSSTSCANPRIGVTGVFTPPVTG